MGITLEEALKIEPFNQCRIVAGSRGLNRMVRSASVIDAPDVVPWLKAGDLLLTTGYVFHQDEKAQVQLIRDLNERKGAGLGIKPKRFLPVIPKPMIEEANRLDFPLFEIGFNLHFSDMILALTQRILTDQSRFTDKIEGEGFLSDLLKGSLSSEKEILNQGRPYGLLTDHVYTVLCIGFFSDHPTDLQWMTASYFHQLIREAAASCKVKLIAAKLDEYAVLMQTSGSASKDLARKVASWLTERMTEHIGHERISIGIGKAKQKVTLIPASYREAKEAVYLGKRISRGKEEMSYEFSDLEPEALLQHLPDDLLKRYVAATLKPLIQYDREMGSDLVRTLDVYLASGRHIGETAKALYIHRNTVKFRVSRIEQLLGVDLTDGETAFRLRLGLRLANLIEGSQSFIHRQ